VEYEFSKEYKHSRAVVGLFVRVACRDVALHERLGSSS
jgi:hypothetical protein